MEKTSSEEYSRRFRERSRRFEEAIDAAKSAARGMNRAEARQRIVAELRARGIVMTPPGVDLILQDVMLGIGIAGGMRRAAWHMGNLAELTGGAIRFINAAARHNSSPSAKAPSLTTKSSSSAVTSSRSGSVTRELDMALPLVATALVMRP